MLALARRLAALLVLLALLGSGAARADGYMGAQACAACHAAEAESWSASHHAVAMERPGEATVLGDFSGATFTEAGVTTTFLRDGDAFVVRTQGPDGGLHDYTVAHTIGVYPLQQYLIAMPGGRFQVLGIAWDTRPKDAGGQRWYALYPGQALAPSDPMHWTGREQTWNHQCADCHTTDLHRNFDLSANRYVTTWSEANVSCEACHGPGAAHVAWAKARKPGDPDPGLMGLRAWLKATDGGTWEMNPDTGIAGRTRPLASGEMDACATCHARRKLLEPTPEAGEKLLDKALPALLEPGLYHADGQIDGEVFEYGSFVQSRMHRAGVTCTNCHDPHTAKLKAEGNALCAQCHMPARFDTAAHHHHEPGSAGAQCANCHMATKTYMGVDARRDHSLRVPRPDLSVSLGTPNACTSCHAGKSDAWAAQAVAGWFPGGRQTQPHFGQALEAGRTGAPGAEAKLDALVADAGQPGIARASALVLLGQMGTAASDATVAQAAKNTDALVRAAVPRALAAQPSQTVLAAVLPLLRDPVRAVRVEAARALAGTDPRALSPQYQAALDDAIGELKAAERVDAERPDAHLNLGLLALRRRLPDEAAAEYATALRLDPGFVPAMVNLADLDRLRGQDRDGEALLRKAVALEPGNAAAHHALGLLLARARDYPGAVAELSQASKLAPDNARYAYVYAIALNSTGQAAAARTILDGLHARHPDDREVLSALVSIAQASGDLRATLGYAQALLALSPSDGRLRGYVEELRRRVGG